MMLPPTTDMICSTRIFVNLAVAPKIVRSSDFGPVVLGIFFVVLSLTFRSGWLGFKDSSDPVALFAKGTEVAANGAKKFSWRLSGRCRPRHCGLEIVGRDRNQCCFRTPTNPAVGNAQKISSSSRSDACLFMIVLVESWNKLLYHVHVCSGCMRVWWLGCWLKVGSDFRNL